LTTTEDSWFLAGLARPGYASTVHLQNVPNVSQPIVDGTEQGQLCYRVGTLGKLK